MRMTSEDLRDHFAAAALTGLLAKWAGDSEPDESFARFTAFAAYDMADAMLRERASTNSPEISSTLTIHDAVPAARATDGSIGTDTPEPQRTPCQCSTPREGTSGPVAWAVEAGGELEASFCGRYGREDAADWAEQSNGDIVPLYRYPQDGVVRLPPLDPNGAPGWNAAIGAVREALADAGVDWDTE